MKIYVDEMPENCYECSLCGRFKPPAQQPDIECAKCNLAKQFKTRSEFCILNDLRIHDKQVRADERKKVCKQIREFAYDCFKEFGCFDETDLEHILDEIEKGENDGSVGD